MQRLTAHIFFKPDPTFRRIARFSEEGRERREVVKRDIRADIDRIRLQQICQKRHLHRLTFEIVDNMLAHIGGADAVIDGIVEPIPGITQQIGKPCLAKA